MMFAPDPGMYLDDGMPRHIPHASRLYKSSLDGAAHLHVHLLLMSLPVRCM